MATQKKAEDQNDITIADVEGKYKKFYQGTITNSATAISKKTKPVKKTENSVTYDLAGKTEGSVILTNPAENELSLASSQLMDVITIYLTEKLPHNASDESLTKFLDCKLPPNLQEEFYPEKNGHLFMAAVCKSKASCRGLPFAEAQYAPFMR